MKLSTEKNTTIKKEKKPPVNISSMLRKRVTWEKEAVIYLWKSKQVRPESAV
jgi:hypothetical protein